VVVVTVIIANTAVYLTDAFINLDSGAFLIRSKWNILGDLDEPVEWLILGDSSANQGVVPDQFRAQYDGNAVNLGTVGNALLINDVWMIEDYINQHGAPENVVIVHVYDMWYRRADTAVFAHTPWDYMSDIGMFSTPKERAELALYRYVPLFQSSTQVFRAIANPSQMFKPPISIGDDGFTTVLDPNPSQVERDIESHASGALSKAFVLSSINETAINLLVDLANKHKFQIYIANSPAHEDLVALDSFQLYVSHISDLLEGIDERSPYIHYVLRDLPTFDSSVMENADHVTKEGATSFTAQLIAEIRTNESN